MARAEATTEREHTYVPALDGLRAVAVLLVMAQHLHAFVYPTWSLLPPGGYLGVDLFFVLSGFLITSLLLEERASRGRVSFGRFYRRRAFRLFPALAVFVVVQAAAAAVARQSLRDELHFWAGALTYTTNWVMARDWSVPANTGHLWSLAVEEQFYLVWPVALVLAIRRWGRGAVPLLCVAGIVIAVGSRVHLTHRFGFGYPFVYLHTETRMDALLLGALVAWARQAGWRPHPAVARGLGWVGLAVVGAYAVASSPTDQFLYERAGYTLLAVAGAAVVVGLLDDGWAPSRALSARLPVAIGKLSYSLYLWHTLVLFILLSSLRDRPEVVGTALFVAASFVLAGVSYVLVERPLRTLGHAEQPQRRPAGASVAAPRAAGRLSTWAIAGAGAAVLVGLAAIPAYAARHEILGRDRAVAAAVAAAAAGTNTTSPPPSAPTGVGTPPPVALRVETPATTPPVPGTGATDLVVAATLVDAGGLPMPDRPVRFETVAGGCEGHTDDVGRATCTVSLHDAPAGSPPVETVEASYGGDGRSVPATGSWP